MKKLIAIILVCLLLTGCDVAAVEKETPNDKSMFIMVEDNLLWDVVYHRETRVMYVISMGGYNGGNFTVLLNPDGTPMLWDGQ